MVARIERGAERRPVVARGRLNEDLAKGRLLADLAVGDAVHRAAASEAEAGAARGFLHVAQHVERRVLERGLQRRSDRFVLGVERLVVPARRPEQRLQLRREDRAERRLAILPGHLHALGPVPEVREVQLEAAFIFQLNQRRDFPYVPRFAVGSQAHHLELVAVVGKAEVLRDGQVEEAKRMGKEDVPVDGQARACDAPPRRADEVAEAIDGADRGFVEGRHEGGARQVSRVMLDEAGTAAHDSLVQPHRLRDRGRQRAQEGEVPSARCHRAFRPVLEQEQRLPPEMGARVA